MANEIFFFDSSDVGAPTLNNAAGTVISVLDACLINGFNSKSVTSINVSSNVATVDCTSHGFVAVPGKYVQVAGATPTELNGLKQVASVPNANTFTFAAPGVANGAATGTITAKRAGIGWTKAFTGTNKAVYQSSDPASTALLLRIDDTNSSPATATDARAVMYESMTDVDTGSAPSPTAAQLSGGQFWNKGPNTATAKVWAVVGDGRLFYFFSANSNAAMVVHCFGDIVSYRAADAYGCVIAGGIAAYAGAASTGCQITVNYEPGVNNVTAGLVLARIASATGSAARAYNVSVGRASGTLFGATTYPSFPSPVDNGVVFHRPVWIAEDNATFAYPLRGELPGVLVPLGVQPFSNLEVVSGVSGFTGSLLMIASAGASSTTGRMAFDISNAWRS